MLFCGSWINYFAVCNGCERSGVQFVIPLGVLLSVHYVLFISGILSIEFSSGVIIHRIRCLDNGSGGIRVWIRGIHVVGIITSVVCGTADTGVTVYSGVAVGAYQHLALDLLCLVHLI